MIAGAVFSLTRIARIWCCDFRQVSAPCSHLAHKVRAPAHTLDFSEAGQQLHAPDTVRFILPYTLLLFLSLVIAEEDR